MLAARTAAGVLDGWWHNNTTASRFPAVTFCTSTHLAESGCLHAIPLTNEVVGVPQVLPCS